MYGDSAALKLRVRKTIVKLICRSEQVNRHRLANCFSIEGALDEFQGMMRTALVHWRSPTMLHILWCNQNLIGAKIHNEILCNPILNYESMCSQLFPPAIPSTCSLSILIRMSVGPASCVAKLQSWRVLIGVCCYTWFRCFAYMRVGWIRTVWFSWIRLSEIALPLLAPHAFAEETPKPSVGVGIDKVHTLAFFASSSCGAAQVFPFSPACED